MSRPPAATRMHMPGSIRNDKLPDIAGSLELLGPIVRLQVQVTSLKRGERPRRWYDPAGIRPVPSLRLDDGGVTGLDGGDIADVHHRDHPASKHRDENGVSVGFSGHFARIRDRFGAHLTDGIAGENILVGSMRELAPTDLAAGIVIETAGGPVALSGIEVAAPCVEFSKFCAGYGIDQIADGTITETLRFLHQGMRGFYATLDARHPEPVTVALGDRVYRVIG